MELLEKSTENELITGIAILKDSRRRINMNENMIHDQASGPVA